jgi:hypothetical protein
VLDFQYQKPLLVTIVILQKFDPKVNTKIYSGKRARRGDGLREEKDLPAP